MRARFKSLLFLLFFLIVITTFIGVFYYFYDGFNDEPSIMTSGNLSINYLSGKKIIASKERTIKFSVINTSEESEFYYIEFINTKNIKGDIKYTLTNGDNISITDTMNPYNTIISSYIEIKGGETHNYILTVSPSEKIFYGFEINISVENDEIINFAQKIINDNEVKESPLTTPGSELATTDEGLIKTNDDYGVAYYFRGAVKNNNVVIDNHNYKIVKINGDGSVKLVLDGVADIMKTYYDDVNNYKFKNSTISNYLINEWFNRNINDSKFYVANQKYCNDNTMNQDSSFLAFNRITVDHNPSFICLGDKVQTKVGLLTADEVVYAGATINEDNKSFYLYNESITTNYYLMTGAKMSSSEYQPFTVTSNGKIINTDIGSYLRSVRPVITIIKTAIVSGNGTSEEPYMLTLD